jgi:hypothetical protein
MKRPRRILIAGVASFPFPFDPPNLLRLVSQTDFSMFPLISHYLSRPARLQETRRRQGVVREIGHVDR